jgi:hypothetical protein
LVTPPSVEEHTTLYWKIEEPPLLAGGEYETFRLPTPAVTPVIVGAPGTVGGGGGESVTTAAEFAEGGPKPTLFRAVTLQVYVFPNVR